MDERITRNTMGRIEFDWPSSPPPVSSPWTQSPKKNPGEMVQKSVETSFDTQSIMSPALDGQNWLLHHVHTTRNEPINLYIDEGTNEVIKSSNRP